MAGFRVFIHGRVADPAAFRALGERMAKFVQDNEPGTLAYGWYVAGDGQSINEDGYADDDAFLTHMSNAQKEGTFDEFMATIDVDRVEVLGEAGPAAREMLAGLGAVHYPMVAGY